MERLFAQLRRQLKDFIEQRDDFLMLSVCAVNDVPMVLQTLRDIEQSNSTDVFLLFAGDFISPGPFVTAAIEHLKEEHRIACEALAQKGRAPLPPFPESLLSEEIPSADRLRAAIKFARLLLPRDGGHRLIWAMFPLKIVDRRAYLRMVSALVPWQGVLPWMSGARLIFRADVNFMQIAPELAEAPRVRVERTDFGPEAMAGELEREVENEELPMDQRMQSLLSLAYLDYAHNRSGEATAKFNALLGYAQRTKNATLQSLAINGLGDVAHRGGDLDQARHWYECALVPASEAQQPHVLTVIVKNLGDVSFKLGLYADAEQYFDGLDKLHAHLLDPEGKASALEWRGIAQQEQGNYERAVASWEDAATLCRSIGLPEQLRANLEHLAPMYEQLNMNNKLAALEAELRELQVEVEA